MKTIGIFYGSETGTTEGVARRIARELGVADSDIHNVAKASPSELGGYDVLIFGSSTWGSGDLEQDWYDFIAGAKALDLKGRMLALFGCGDETMSDTFCNAVGELYDEMSETEVEMIGDFDAEGYDFTDSKAERNGRFVGLVLDEVNHPELSGARIKAWTRKIREEME